jgi:hypothetical protein
MWCSLRTTRRSRREQLSYSSFRMKSISTQVRFHQCAPHYVEIDYRTHLSTLAKDGIMIFNNGRTRSHCPTGLLITITGLSPTSGRKPYRQHCLAGVLWNNRMISRHALEAMQPTFPPSCSSTKRRSLWCLKGRPDWGGNNVRLPKTENTKERGLEIPLSL